MAAADQAAAALGLRPGLAMAQALALIPGLQVVEAEPDADADALRRLALWCNRYTPLAAPCPPDALWLDITGCARGDGERHLLDHLLARLARDGLHAHGAIADTPGAAYAIARYGAASAIVPPGGQAEAIAVLPVAALRVAPEMEATLRRLGFEQVCHLARIPRALLTRRFGPFPALRLDQAHGRVKEPITPIMPEPLLQRRIAFLEPLLTPESLQAAIAHLVGPLCQEMEHTAIGARQLDLLFERVDSEIAAIRIGTARPVRDAAHLIRLFCERLDTIDPGLGVEAMHLTIPLAEPLQWQQPDASPGVASSTGDVARLVDRLASRLGPDRVYRAAPVQSSVPERAVRKSDPMEQAAPPITPDPGPITPLAIVYTRPARLAEPSRPGVSEHQHPAPARLRVVGAALAMPIEQEMPLPWKPRYDAARFPHFPAIQPPWPGCAQAPTRLLHPPRPIQALAALPDQPPVAFTWRNHRHRVRRADGPDRMKEEWWTNDREGIVRDYFRVEDERGQRFWLFRKGDGIDPGTGPLTWFLHGFF